MASIDHDLEKLMSHLGDFGKYQAWQFSLHILAALTAGLHMLSLVTVAAVPDHHCSIPGLDVENASFLLNSSEVSSYNPNHSMLLGSCELRDGNGTVVCDSWVYDTTYYQSSRGIEWNFVCSRRWMRAVAQSAYMFGVFTGAVSLGSMADTYGRKKIFYISSVAQLFLGVGVALIPEYYTFLVVTFFYGMFGSAGAYITGFVLTMEIVGPSKRTVCGIMFQAAFALGSMLVAGWGAVIKNRMWLQIVYGLHSALLIGHWWLVDESPRWLWGQGQTREAISIIKRGLRMNKVNVEIDVAELVSKRKIRKADEEERELGIADLFRTPNLRRMALNVCLNFFANSIVYYGLSLNSDKMLGNPFLMLFLLGLVEYPSYVFTIALMDRTGRRCLTSTLMLMGGMCCIIAAWMSKDTPGEATFVVTITMLGKAFIAGSFAIIYNYAAELFPTVLRNTALGVGSMCARLSGALTPLIMLLDSLDARIPATLFGFIALLSGFLTLYLPETLNQPMPQTLEDGEKFGVGDTCFTTFCGQRRRDKRTYDIALQQVDAKENNA